MADRVPIWVSEWGTPDRAAVLLLHGAYDHGRMFDELAPAIAALGFRAIAPDLRGHGRSTRLTSGHAWRAVQADIAGLAREAGAANGGHPVAIVGHSWGAGLAISCAGFFPELVNQIVLLDGLGRSFWDDGTTSIADRAREGFERLRAVKGRPARVFATRAEMVERRSRMNPRLPRHWVEHLVDLGSRPVEGGWEWLADPVFSTGLPGPFSPDHIMREYELVRCPVLAISGTEPDSWRDITAEEEDARVARIVGARHVRIAGAGHYVHLEQPQPVIAAVGEFLIGNDRP